MILNERQLNKMCEELMNMIWGEKLEIPVKINGRLKSSHGRMIALKINKRIKPDCIEISKSLLNSGYKLSTIESIIKHELCHYYLCKIGKPFRDGDITFENELKRIGSHSTGIIESVNDHHHCICNKCNSVAAKYSSKKLAMNAIDKYYSVCCSSDLLYKYVPNLTDNTNEIATEYTVIHKYAECDSEVIRDKVILDNEIICANNKLKIEDVVVKKRNTVSQKNVFDAVKLAVDEKSIDKLILINQYYPELFNKVSKLMGKKRFNYINENIC